MTFDCLLICHWRGMRHYYETHQGAAMKTTLQQVRPPQLDGGFCAAIINNQLILSMWDESKQIEIQLGYQEIFNLKFFIKDSIDALMSADKPMPDAYRVSGRRKP
jgi:hypothetical protein